jgi:hypothetical protein
LKLAEGILKKCPDHGGKSGDETKLTRVLKFTS